MFGKKKKTVAKEPWTREVFIPKDIQKIKHESEYPDLFVDLISKRGGTGK